VAKKQSSKHSEAHLVMTTEKMHRMLCFVVMVQVQQALKAGSRKKYAGVLALGLEGETNMQ